MNYKHFSPLVDIWSVGCIMAELLTSKVLFPGGDRIFLYYTIYLSLHLVTPLDGSWSLVICINLGTFHKGGIVIKSHSVYSIIMFGFFCCYVNDSYPLENDPKMKAVTMSVVNDGCWLNVQDSYSQNFFPNVIDFPNCMKDIDQLTKIMQLVGKPSPDFLSKITSENVSIITMLKFNRPYL